MKRALKYVIACDHPDGTRLYFSGFGSMCADWTPVLEDALLFTHQEPARCMSHTVRAAQAWPCSTMWAYVEVSQ